MSSENGSSALVYIKAIQWCGKKSQVVLKVPGEDIDWKLFSRMGHVRLVVGSSKLEFLPDLRQLKEHRFGFTGHRSSEVCNVLNYVIDGF